MRLGSRCTAALLLAACLALAGCRSQPATATAENTHARVESIAGSQVKRVILSQQAVDRLGIRTVAVRANTVPYSAVIYDTSGTAWVYTVPQPLTFVRQKLEVATVGATDAMFSTGPAAGTVVVVTGAPELLGAELGVGQ
ncbi:MAG TPA: hypothetical protein VI011_09325 [Asanoa sp.]